MVYAIALVSAALGVFADYEIARSMLRFDHPVMAAAAAAVASTGLIAMCLVGNQALP